MSMDVQVTKGKSAFETWKEGIKGTEPQLVGKGTVKEKGLAYTSKSGQFAHVWDGTVDDLDEFQLKLNNQGVTNINRAYRFDVEGTVPVKQLSINTIATRMAGWPTGKMNVGDVVNLYAWRQGNYVQFGFKKE